MAVEDIPDAATVVAEDSVLWRWEWDCESVMVVLLTDQLVLVQKQSPVSSVRWPWSTLIHCADFHDEYDWFLFSISNVYLSNITKYLQVMSMSSFRFHHVLFFEEILLSLQLRWVQSNFGCIFCWLNFRLNIVCFLFFLVK